MPQTKPVAFAPETSRVRARNLARRVRARNYASLFLSSRQERQQDAYDETERNTYAPGNAAVIDFRNFVCVHRRSSVIANRRGGKKRLHARWSAKYVS